ncbi:MULTISPECIES: methylated-DNA--[protein]-cysteine S-methyltransferase [Bacillaceae]|uniref:methylated-DNA--[protein]-cysteine S-methyltransferase n=1 Tax=Bacillales TaxID=1385 RepID=UPI001883FC38|nr:MULTISPECIES: methylated-DNA--[protein]-cysteine S-methyltransferase [Bacillaceae]MBF0706948.1 methylated-DNA--[protein]-cysteine S-methyltransferase [Pseudalkalibacillus hwajinpoensis]MDO6656775.1 methylated-DNA--[protein]-cysteine S-methyltransferase [Anaerobacillus sp. 1_MG-2023]
MEKQVIHYGEFLSPIGAITLFASPNGVSRLDFGCAEDVLPIAETWYKKHHVKADLVFNSDIIEPIVMQLEEYFSGKRRFFDLKLDKVGTIFQQKVWNNLSEIPYGETRSYRDVAVGISAPKAVRAIGSANNRNPIPIIVPCHRVIGSNGALVGYGGGVDKKEYLLSLEQQHSMHAVLP